VRSAAAGPCPRVPQELRMRLCGAEVCGGHPPHHHPAATHVVLCPAVGAPEPHHALAQLDPSVAKEVRPRVGGSQREILS
jgi:hypothetical protein